MSHLRPSNRILLLKFVSFFILVSAIFMSRMIHFYDADVFMHLRFGEIILDEHQIPSTDPLTWVAAGEPYTDHEWLFQIIAALTHRLGGDLALSVLRALLIALTFALLWVELLRRHRSFGFALALTLAGALTSWGLSEARPYIFSPLFLVIVWSCYWRWRATEKRKWLLPLPLVFLSWANIHAGFTSGLILLALLGLGEVVETWRASGSPEFPTARGRFRILVATALLCGLATWLNPYGAEIWLFPFKIVGKKIFATYILEWGRTDFSLPFFPFWVLALWLAASLVANRRAFLPGEWLAGLVFLLLPFTARRHISLFPVIALPLLASYGVPWSKWSEPGSKTIKWVAASFGLLLMAIFIAIMTLSGILSTGVGPDPRIFPISSARLLSRLEVQEERLFNDLNFGGFLEWTLHGKFLIAFDGRVDVFGSDRIEKFIGFMQGGGGTGPQYLKSHGVQFALVGRSSTMGSRNLTTQLEESGDWQLVMWDDRGLLYATNEAIEKHQPLLEASLTKPWLDAEEEAQRFSSKAQLRAAAEQLAARYAQFDAGDGNIAEYLYREALCRILLGQYDVARDRLGEYLQRRPVDARAWNKKGLSLAALKKYSEAEGDFAAAQKLRPKWAEPPYNRACALALLGRADDALDQLQHSLELGGEGIAALATADDSLKSLRSNPRFRQLLKPYASSPAVPE
ncbi:MAG: hypothetical protein V2A74_08360 [bacterium]